MRRRSDRGDRSDPADVVAGVAQRLAVLLAAGVPPAGAWGYLDITAPVVVAVRQRLALGDSLTEALDAAVRALTPDTVPASEARAAAAPRRRGLVAGEAAVEPAGWDPTPWRALAAALAVASDAGAPLAPSLRRFARSLRDVVQAQRDVAVAMAGPLATVRLVVLLPLVAVGFGVALGFDTIGVLLGTPAGLGCLTGGCVLIAVGRRWSRSMAREAAPRREVPGILHELVAIALSGGGSITHARIAAVRAVTDRGLHGERHSAELAAVDAVLELSRRAGVPAAELLRSEAEEVRRQLRSAAQGDAARLAVRLLVPLALCILPAFMLLGVAPLLLSVIGVTVG